MVGAGKGIVHLAHVQAAREAQVVAEFRVDHRCARVQCCFHIDSRRQQRPFDLQILQRVFGLRARLGHDGHHRLALPAGPVDRQRVLRRRLHTGQMPECGHPGFTNFGQIRAIGHQHDARHAPGKFCVDAGDAAVRDRAAPEHHMRHARQHDVIHVATLALHQAPRARTFRAVTDVTWVLREIVQCGLRLVCGDGAHAADSRLRCASTSHTASTMAW